MIASVYQLLDYAQREYADRCAFKWYNNSHDEILSKTYAEFVQDVRRCAMALKCAIPDIEQKHIGLLPRTDYDNAVCIFGVMLAGAVAVPMNGMESAENLSYQTDLADVDYLIIGRGVDLHEKGLGRFTEYCFPVDFYKNENVSAELKDCLGREHLNLLFFTSGTTGCSKCVMISNAGMFSQTSDFSSFQTQTNQAKVSVLLSSPLFHVSGVASALMHLLLGNEMDLCSDMRYLYSDIVGFGSMTVFAVPMLIALWEKDLRRGHREKLGNLRIITTGGASAEPDTFKLFMENGIAIYQAYGLTEVFGGGTTNASMDASKHASIGKATPGVEIRIIDGELCIRSKAVMQGYYKDPEATAEAIQDGWLHTGDLGYIDEDGYVFLTGRKKNLIILSGGENVSPEELETLLAKNPAVTEVLVKQKDNKICAEIFCEPESQETMQDYVSELNKTLPMYKRITALEFRSEAFPRTATGKLKRG